MSKQQKRSFADRFGRVIASGGIAAIPATIYHHQGELELTVGQVWFISYILSFKWTAGAPYPSMRKMTKRTGVDRRTLRRYQKQLVDKKYLELKPKESKTGANGPHYHDFSGLFKKLEEIIIHEKGYPEEYLDPDDL